PGGQVVALLLGLQAGLVLAAPRRLGALAQPLGARGLVGGGGPRLLVGAGLLPGVGLALLRRRDARLRGGEPLLELRPRLRGFLAGGLAVGPGPAGPGVGVRGRLPRGARLGEGALGLAEDAAHLAVQPVAQHGGGRGQLLHQLAEPVDVLLEGPHRCGIDPGDGDALLDRFRRLVGTGAVAREPERRGQRTVVRGLLIVAHASILVKTPQNRAPSRFGRPSYSGVRAGARSRETPGGGRPAGESGEEAAEAAGVVPHGTPGLRPQQGEGRLGAGAGGLLGGRRFRLVTGGVVTQVGRVADDEGAGLPEGVEIILAPLGAA